MRRHEATVPVTMGSPWFRAIEGQGFTCTLARFPADAVLAPHTHDRPTFAVILKGGFGLSFTSPAVRRSRLACKPGTVFVEPAGERHANHVRGGGAEVIVFQPDPSHQAWAPFSPLLGRIQHFDHGGLALDARRLAGEVKREDPFSTHAAEAVALQMLVTASRLLAKGTRSKGRPSWLRQVDEYVHDCFRDRLRIRDVACVAGVHPSHVAAVFRDFYGMPIGTYVRRLRLEWSRDRLHDSDLSISAISYAAGYADQSHLTREFKRWMGITPAAYRSGLPTSGDSRVAAGKGDVNRTD